MKSINPATGKINSQHKLISEKQILSKIDKAHKEFLSWGSLTVKQRAVYMKKLSKIISGNKDDAATLITLEMGKVYKEAIAEVEKCAWVAQFYAENSEKYLSDEVVDTGSGESIIAYRPLGVLLAVMPWNFPMWQVLRFAIPAIMAGNTVVLKHSSNVPGCALKIEDLFREAGFPSGVFTTLLINSKQVEKVIANKKIRGVSLTGSVTAGSAIASMAGKYLKKTVLELGGSDPYIVLKDADIDKAVEACVTCRLVNNGQTCVAGKRFIVVADVYDEFVKKYAESMRNIKMGNPFEASYRIGPMASVDLRDELHKQVISSIEKGAKCIVGGKIPKITGAFYPATVLVNVKPGMPAYDEELFGPVAAVIKAKNEEDAIRIANDSDYGLGGGLFTKNKKRGKIIARDLIETGSCYVNGFVRSDPRLPFGGVKNSGYGRELSAYGIREFTNIKAVHVE